MTLKKRRDVSTCKTPLVLNYPSIYPTQNITKKIDHT